MTDPAFRFRRPHPIFEDWAERPAPGPIDRRLVHKNDDANVLLGRLERVGAHRFAAQLHLVADHPFFFEHACDHVPGLALVEWGRQTGIAVAHRFYDVPLDGFAFVIRELSVTFTSFAELDGPVFGESEVTEVVERRGVLHQMRFGGHFLQHGTSIGTIEGQWTVLPDAVMRRLRKGPR
ncbi:MAG: AfsA-related hotdog domain-containing protein [Myxococcota bacterium]